MRWYRILCCYRYKVLLIALYVRIPRIVLYKNEIGHHYTTLLCAFCIIIINIYFSLPRGFRFSSVYRSIGNISHGLYVTSTCLRSLPPLKPMYFLRRRLPSKVFRPLKNTQVTWPYAVSQKDSIWQLDPGYLIFVVVG